MPVIESSKPAMTNAPQINLPALNDWCRNAGVPAEQIDLFMILVSTSPIALRGEQSMVKVADVQHLLTPADKLRTVPEGWTDRDRAYLKMSDLAHNFIMFMDYRGVSSSFNVIDFKQWDPASDFFHYTITKEMLGVIKSLGDAGYSSH